jgi:hypothetical protein
MDEPARADGEPAKERLRDRYLRQVHVALVTALVIICVALGIVGWQLHPGSSGFVSIPQPLSILVSGSKFVVTETMRQTGDGGAVVRISTLGGPRYTPLKDSEPISRVFGPTGAGPEALSTAPVATLDGTPIPNHSWAFLVLHPGAARPCADDQRYRAGAVKLPFQPPQPALVVAPPPPGPIETTGDYVAPPALCLRWSTAAPVGLSGPYLSARFPPLRGTTGIFTQIAEPGDVGAQSVTRVLSLSSGNTADFNIQTDPHPDGFAPTYWTWVTGNSPQVVQLAAVNTSQVQRENNNAFYSGILFGVVGGALIALITELVMPLSRRRERQ